MPPFLSNNGPKFTMREAFLFIQRILQPVTECPRCGRCANEASLLAKLCSELLAIIERDIIEGPPAILVPKGDSFVMYAKTEDVRAMLLNILHLQSVKHLLGEK